MRCTHNTLFLNVLSTSMINQMYNIPNKTLIFMESKKLVVDIVSISSKSEKSSFHTILCCICGKTIYSRTHLYRYSYSITSAMSFSISSTLEKVFFV